MKCSAWIRGGPTSWAKKADDRDESQMLSDVAWQVLPWVAMALGIVAMIVAMVTSNPLEAGALGSADAGPTWVTKILSLVLASGAGFLAWKVSRSIRVERGWMIACIGAAFGFVFGPWVFLLIALAM